VTIVSVTRLRLRSVRFMPHLYWDARRIKQSLKKAPGYLGGKLLVDQRRAYWTITLWDNLESMNAFRYSKVHAEVALLVDKWCDEASVVHWESDDVQFPSWKEAHRRMTETGKLTPLTFPSADHQAHKFREPYWTKSREESLGHLRKTRAPKAA